MSQHGYSAVIIDDTREGEDPTYLFTKRNQLIAVPEVVDETHQTSLSALPELFARTSLTMSRVY